MKIFSLFIALGLFVVALRAGEFYTQFARYKNYWDFQNSLPINKEDIVYIALGDSAAQGIGASGPEKGYVGLIASELHNKTNKNVRVINLSKSGAKISDVLNTQLPKYELLKIYSPAVVTIEIGANDMKSFEEVKFEREMNELMDKLPKGTVMSDLPYFGSSRHKNINPNVIKANEIMYRLAKKKNIELAPLYDSAKNNTGIRIFSVDLFHPSNYGYRNIWLPAFMSRIDTDKIK